MKRTFWFLNWFFDDCMCFIRKGRHKSSFIQIEHKRRHSILIQLRWTPFNFWKFYFIRLPNRLLNILRSMVEFHDQWKHIYDYLMIEFWSNERMVWTFTWGRTSLRLKTQYRICIRTGNQLVFLFNFLAKATRISYSCYQTLMSNSILF